MNNTLQAHKMRSYLHLLVVVLLAESAEGIIDPIKTIRRDWAALNMRSSTRHLMRPRTPAGRSECLALKLQLREAVASEGTFVVDAFAALAEEHSIDEDTRLRGGLLGERLKQGECRSKELDRACFTAPLGQVSGPIESEFGHHLVLVQERIGCRYDSGMTRVVPEACADGPNRSVLAPAEPDEPSAVAYPIFSAALLLLFALAAGQAIAELAGLVAPPVPLSQLAADLGIE